MGFRVGRSYGTSRLWLRLQSLGWQPQPVVHMFSASSEEGKDVMHQFILEALPSDLHDT